METTIKIVQDLLLHELEKDSNFNPGNVSIAFWESFAKYLLNFEEDDKPVYALINGLIINNTEVITSALPYIYEDFILELAESYVLGKKSFGTKHLLTTKNPLFQEQVIFLKTLEDVIEEKRREKLKKMFRKWDKELAKKETKVISLSWMKYAIAACFAFVFSTWFFKNQSNQYNLILPEETLAEVSIDVKSVDIIKNKDLGFTSEEKQVTIIQNLHGDRITSINKAIKTYQELINEERFVEENKASLEQLNNRIIILQKELISLKEKEKLYRFNTSEINVYDTAKTNRYKILQLDSIYYLIKNKTLFRLTQSKTLLPYKEVNDNSLKTNIDDLLFINGIPIIND